MSHRTRPLLLLAVVAATACGPTDTKKNRPDAAPLVDGAVAIDARLIDGAVSIDARVVPDAAPTPDAVPSPDAMPPANDAAPADAAPVDGAAPPYTHSITIDGTNDFVTADERFDSTSTGYYGYVAWDSTYLYVGVEGADVAANSATKWVVLYIGGTGGTATSVRFNTQQPALPFAGKYHVSWRTDNGLTQALRWNTASWVDAGWDFTDDVFQSGTFMEMRIPLADIDNPSSLDLHLAMLNEQGGAEGTYAGVPSTSFTDGYDPDYLKFFRFAIGGTTKPTAHTPLP